MKKPEIKKFDIVHGGYDYSLHIGVVVSDPVEYFTVKSGLFNRHTDTKPFSERLELDNPDCYKECIGVAVYVYASNENYDFSRVKVYPIDSLQILNCDEYSAYIPGDFADDQILHAAALQRFANKIAKIKPKEDITNPELLKLEDLSIDGVHFRNMNFKDTPTIYIPGPKPTQETLKKAQELLSVLGYDFHIATGFKHLLFDYLYIGINNHPSGGVEISFEGVKNHLIKVKFLNSGHDVLFSSIEEGKAFNVEYSYDLLKEEILKVKAWFEANPFSH